MAVDRRWRSGWCVLVFVGLVWLIVPAAAAAEAASSMPNGTAASSTIYGYGAEPNDAQLVGDEGVVNADRIARGSELRVAPSTTGDLYDRSAHLVAPNATDTTRVGRWMSQAEHDEMVDSRFVLEGAGGRTYVVEPPNPAAYPSAKPGSVCSEFDVPSDSLRTASKPEWAVIPGPNVTTGIYGPPPPAMPPATCIVCVTSN